MDFTKKASSNSLRLLNISQSVLIKFRYSVKFKNYFFQIPPDSDFCFCLSRHIMNKYIGDSAFIGAVNIDKYLVPDVISIISTAFKKPSGSGLLASHR